jgi:hypothetical protein
MEINLEKLKFKADNEWFRLGGRLYPVTDPESLRAFTFQNTEDVAFEKDFINDFNSLDLKMGYCYSNAQKIYELCISHGLDAHYYAGWQFINNSYPNHHAWVVVEGEGIIDPSISIREVNVYETTPANTPNVREVVAEKLKSLRKVPVTVSDDIQMGKIIRNYIVYVGSKDNKDSARDMITNIRSKYPQHEINKSSKPGRPTDMQMRIGL